jgi:hypothetical protein
LAETTPDVGDIYNKLVTSGNSSEYTSDDHERISNFDTRIFVELELLHLFAFYLNGYFEIAVDDENDPSELYIVSDVNPICVEHNIRFRLKDANEAWHTIFQYLFLRTKISVGDGSGGHIHFRRSEMGNNFSHVLTAWREYFGSPFGSNYDDFDKIARFFKSIVAPIGYTIEPATPDNSDGYYNQFGLTTKLLSSTLEQVLPVLSHERGPLFGKQLVPQVTTFSFVRKLVEIGTSFSLSSVRGPFYFTLTPQWYFNRIAPVLARFARDCHLTGPSFEEDVSIFVDLYHRYGYEIAPTGSSLSFTIQPRTKGRARRLPQIKVIDKSVPVYERRGKELRQTAEIDFAILANGSLYLVEAKSIYLEAHLSRKYLTKKAPRQCAQYVKWVKRTEFNNFLRKHSLSEKSLKAVRIVVLTNGVASVLSVVDRDSAQRFSVVPEHIFFAVMAGVLPGVIGEQFPTRIISGGLAALREVFPIAKDIRALTNEGSFASATDSMVKEWISLMLYDRRGRPKKQMSTVKPTRGLMYLEDVMQEGGRWVLPQPIQVGEAAGWRFFLGSQLGDAGTTFACKKCRIAIRVYWPVDRKSTAELSSHLKTWSCPECKSPMGDDADLETKGKMTEFCASFKNRRFAEMFARAP